MKLVSTIALVVIALSVVWLAFMKPSEGDRERELIALGEAFSALDDASTILEQYYEREREYAWLHEIFQAYPSWEDELELTRRLRIDIRTSMDHQAAFVLADYSRHGGVACARLLVDDRAAAPRHPTMRKVDTPAWHLKPPLLECRRTGFPWALLHWAGAGYFDVEEMEEAIQLRYRSRGREILGGGYPCPIPPVRTVLQSSI